MRPVSTSRGSVTLLEGRIMCTDTVVHTWSALVVLVGLSGRLWAAMPAQLLARPRPDPAPAKHFGTRAQVMLLVFGRPWHFTESLDRLPGRIAAFISHFCGSVSECASAFWKKWPDLLPPPPVRWGVKVTVEIHNMNLVLCKHHGNALMSNFVVSCSMREARDTHSVGVATYFLDYLAGFR